MGRCKIHKTGSQWALNEKPQDCVVMATHSLELTMLKQQEGKSGRVPSSLCFWGGCGVPLKSLHFGGGVYVLRFRPAHQEEACSVHEVGAHFPGSLKQAARVLLQGACLDLWRAVGKAEELSVLQTQPTHDSTVCGEAVTIAGSF